MITLTIRPNESGITYKRGENLIVHTNFPEDR